MEDIDVGKSQWGSAWRRSRTICGGDHEDSPSRNRKKSPSFFFRRRFSIYRLLKAAWLRTALKYTERKPHHPILDLTIANRNPKKNKYEHIAKARDGSKSIITSQLASCILGKILPMVVRDQL